MNFLNLVESTNIFFIQTIFLLNFLIIFIFSYPLGRLMLNKKSDNLFFCSFISTTLFAVLIACVVNFAAIISKYLIIFFFIINFYLLLKYKIISKSLISKLKKSIKKLFVLSLFYFLILNFFYPIDQSIDSIKIPYDRHLIYYFAPIYEIINAEYFSRIRVSTLYPMEWAAFYFFQSSFSSIYLNFFTEFGFLGLVFLKIFFIAILLSDLLFLLIKKKYFKTNFENKILIYLLYINLFYYLFLNSNLIWSILGNQSFTIFATYFIFKYLFQNNKDNLHLSNIILIIASFKNLIFSVFFFIILSFKNTKNNISYFVKKIKFKKQNKIINLFIFLLFTYLIITFFSAENVVGKFHVLGSLAMWESTFTYKIINKKILFISLIAILTILKLIFRKKNYNSKNIFNYQNVLFISLILFIPTVSLVILEINNFLINLFKNPNVEIYFESFNFNNLKFYFFIPILWAYIVSFDNNLSLSNYYNIKITILLSITAYTFFSLFIHNHVILPAIYILEIFFVFWLIFCFLREKKILINKITILLIIVTINFSSYPIKIDKPINQVLVKYNEIKKINDLNFFCENDLNKIKYEDNVIKSDLLSGLLSKRYYSELAFDEDFNYYENFHLAVPMALPQKDLNASPCKV